MRKFLVGVAVLAVLGVLAWQFWPREPLQAVLATVERGAVEQVASNTRAGTVKACQRSKLSMPMGGRVERLLVKEGDHVKKGAILLELWNDDREAQVAQSRAALAVAGQQEQQACLTAAQSARDAVRVDALSKQQLVSADTVDHAATKMQVADAVCGAARSQVATARAAVRVQNAMLEETRLRAPFAGIVAEINGEVGEYVTPSPPGVATPPAVDLIDDSCLYVTAPIDEVDAAGVKPALPARITMDAFRGRTFPAHVERIAPYVVDKEKQARTVDVDVRFEQVPGDILLLAGYSADVDIILARHDNVLRLPAEALIGGKSVLLWDRETKKLAQREVKIGISNWTWIEVLGGLQEGDRVAVSIDREGIVAGATVEPEQAVEPGKQ